MRFSIVALILAFIVALAASAPVEWVLKGPFPRMRDADRNSLPRVAKRTTTADEPGATHVGPHPVRGSHNSRGHSTDMLPLAGLYTHEVCMRNRSITVHSRTSFPSVLSEQKMLVRFSCKTSKHP